MNTSFINQTCRLSSLGKSVEIDIFLAQPPYNFTEENVCKEGVMLCDPRMPDCKCEVDNQTKYNLLDFSTNKEFTLPLSNISLIPPLPDNFEHTVEECCKTAEKCCNDHLRFDVQLKNHCPATWDGWSCFEKAKPGIIRASCPDFAFGLRWNLKNSEKAVIKHCKGDGTWDGVRFNGVERERTDYSNCHQEEIWLKPMLLVTFIAYCLSAIALFPALLVISCNRRLKNYNIFSIHRQLLLSLFLSSTLYVVNGLLFSPFHLGAYLFLQNHFICRILFILQYAYLKLTSFAWMLVEALHLYWLLFQTNAQLSSELSNEIMLLTWLIPGIFTVVYALLIELFDNQSCKPETNNLLIKALIMLPCAFCLLVNMTILIGTLRLLLEKLRTDQNSSSLNNYKKILRALLVLIPLFGVNLLLDIYSTDNDLHDILNMLLTSLNGLLISLIVCYFNRAKP
ncbi:G-protein coupled receptor [Aphelenchoides bicaudatus]|nr:G-protein coupled receptor [Aphelenchoides bicaudatus]